MVNQDA